MPAVLFPLLEAVQQCCVDFCVGWRGCPLNVTAITAALYSVPVGHSASVFIGCEEQTMDRNFSGRSHEAPFRLWDVGHFEARLTSLSSLPHSSDFFPLVLWLAPWGCVCVCRGVGHGFVSVGTMIVRRSVFFIELSAVSVLWLTGVMCASQLESVLSFFFFRRVSNRKLGESKPTACRVNFCCVMFGF